jgi:MYXO-CTERM domain-containing protein
VRHPNGGGRRWRARTLVALTSMLGWSGFAGSVGCSDSQGAGTLGPPAERADSWTSEPAATPAVTRIFDPETFTCAGFALDGDTIVGSGRTAQTAPLPDGMNDPAVDGFVLVKGGGAWPEQASLVDQAGQGLAGVGLSGDTAIFGASPRAVDSNDGDAPGPHGAHIYARAGGAWTEQAVLSGDDIAFGRAVAVSGDTAVVSDPYDELYGVQGTHAAQVFVRSGAVWSWQADLADPGDPVMDGFGAAVAIDGDTVAVMGRREVLIFSRTGSTWAPEATIQPPNFGLVSMSLSGDTLVVVAEAGSSISWHAHVFRRSSGGSWTQETQVTSDPDYRFTGVAISGETLVLGNSGWTLPNPPSGRALVYARAGTTWTLTHTLAPSGATSEFGNFVGISEETVAAWDVEQVTYVRDNAQVTVFASSIYLFDGPPGSGGSGGQGSSASGEAVGGGGANGVGGSDTAAAGGSGDGSSDASSGCSVSAPRTSPASDAVVLVAAVAAVARRRRRRDRRTR